MDKPVTNVTPEELEKLASEAWSMAAREALRKGLAVTGSRDGRRYRYYPDGRVDDLGPVAGNEHNPADKKPTVPSKASETAEPIKREQDKSKKSVA